MRCLVYLRFQCVVFSSHGKNYWLPGRLEEKAGNQPVEAEHFLSSLESWSFVQSINYPNDIRLTFADLFLFSDISALTMWIL